MGDRTLLQKIYLSSGLGIPVQRVSAADLTGWTTIFTITGGPVLVTMLLGNRTVIQGGGASNISFRHSIGNTVIGAAAATSATDAVNTLYTVTGNFADVVTQGLAGVPILGGIAGGLLATGNQGKGIIMAVGNIQVNFSAAAPTGSCEYFLSYIPVSPLGVVNPA